MALELIITMRRIIVAIILVVEEEEVVVVVVAAAAASGCPKARGCKIPPPFELKRSLRSAPHSSRLSA